MRTRVLVSEIKAGDVLVSVLTGKPKWAVRSVTRHHEPETGEYANLDVVPLADPKPKLSGYHPIELPLDASVEILR